MMRKLRLLAMGVAALFAVAAVSASGASAKTVLELKSEGKTLAKGAEVGIVGGYSPECYYEEDLFKVAVNGAKTDKLTSSENGTVEDCDGGAKTIELTSAGKMTVKMSPMRIHEPGPCVYEFKKVSGTFKLGPFEPEINGSVTSKLYKKESGACAKTQTTGFEIFLADVETEVITVH
jgi:hypothetical protein